MKCLKEKYLAEGLEKCICAHDVSQRRASHKRRHRLCRTPHRKQIHRRVRIDYTWAEAGSIKIYTYSTKTHRKNYDKPSNFWSSVEVASKTQSQGLTERYGITIISTGEILRNEMKQDTPLGRKAKTLSIRGKWRFDEVIIEMIEGILKSTTTKGIYSMDSRTVVQVEAFDKMPHSSAIGFKLF